MMRIITIYILLISIFLTNCSNNTDDSINIGSTSNTDSLVKLFFYNFDKEKCDSVYFEINKKSKFGDKLIVSVDTIFKKLSNKMTLTYDHYSFYALDLSLRGNHKKALELILEGEKLPHKKSKVAFDKALIWASMLPLGKRELLYKYLDEAVYFDSLNPYYISSRSQFYNEDSLFNKALNDVNKAIKLAPNDTGLVNLRGSYKNALKDYKGAINDLKHIASDHMDDEAVYLQKAYAYSQLKMFKDSYSNINKSISLNPNIAKSYSLRAIAKNKLFNDYDGAIEDLRKAATLGDAEAIAYMKKYEAIQKTYKKS